MQSAWAVVIVSVDVVTESMVWKVWYENEFHEGLATRTLNVT